MNYKLINIDLAKTVFQVAVFNHDNTFAFNRKVNRSALLNTLTDISDNGSLLQC